MSDPVLSFPNTNGARRGLENVPDRGDDYVLEGLTQSADWESSTLTVRHGELLIVDSGTCYWARPNKVRLDIPSGSSSVYYNVDPSTDTGTVIIQSSDPGQPFLKIGTVDASAQTTDDSINRNPTLQLESVGGAKIASPGEIQEKIDEFASANTTGKVYLESDEVYDPSSTVEVKKPVLLDGQRAEIQPSTDQQIFDVHPQAAIRDIVVNIATNFSSWSSTVIRCSADSGTGGSWAGRYPVLVNVALLGNQTSYPPGGTFVKFQSTSSGHLTFLDNRSLYVMSTEDDGLSGQNHAIGTGIHLEDNGGFLNSLLFDNCAFAGCDIHILQDGTGSTNNGHRFTNMMLQPEDGATDTTGDESKVGWDIQLGGNNYFSGMMWDNTNWQTASVRTGSGAGDNNVVDSAFANSIRDTQSKSSNTHIIYRGGDFEAGGDVATNNETSRAIPFEHHNCTANNSITTVQLPENPEPGTEVYVSAVDLTNELRVETTDGESILGATSIDASTDRFTVNTLDVAIQFRYNISFGWAPSKAD